MSLIFRRSATAIVQSSFRHHHGVSRGFASGYMTCKSGDGPKQYPGEWPTPPEISIEDQEKLRELIIPPLIRTNEDIDTKRARLVYQSRKRGILETDLLLSKFAKEHLDTMTLSQLDEYDKFLDENDWDIFYWATYNKRRKVPERWESSEVLQIVRKIAKNEQKQVMRMPPL